MIATLSMMAMFFMTSCQEEAEIIESTESIEEISFRTVDEMEEEGLLGCGGCFSLVYPVTVEFEDGSQVTVGDREEMVAAIKAYYEENPPSRPRLINRPNFVYPIDVMLEDGSVLTLESRDDLKLVLQDCDFEPRRPFNGIFGRHGQRLGLNRCFNLVFPLSIDFPDGSSTEVADREELKDAIKTWKLDNPDAEERPNLSFPYDVELQDGTIITVASEEDKEELKEYCGGLIGEGHGTPCFTINYPVEILFPSGVTISAADREDLIAKIAVWKANNPDAEERPQLVYPITVTYTEDGSELIINSRSEWRDAVRGCR